MAFNLVESIKRMEDAGLLDVLLPFLLIFTIIFAVLEKTKVLGDSSGGNTDINGRSRIRKFNAIVALAIALLIVIPHVVYGSGDARDGRLGGALSGLPDVVEIMNNSLPSVAVWIVLVISILILLGLIAPEWFTTDRTLMGGSMWVKWVLGLLVLIVVGYIFGNSAGFFQNISYGPFAFLTDPGNQATLLIVIIFIAIVFYIMGGDKPVTPGTNQPANPPANRPPGT